MKFSLMLDENKKCHQWNNKSVKVTSLESREDKYTWIIDLAECTAEQGAQSNSQHSYYEFTKAAQNKLSIFKKVDLI